VRAGAAPVPGVTGGSRIEGAPVAGPRSQAARGGAADPSAPAAGPRRAAGLDDGLEAPQVPLDASPEGAEAGAGPLREPLRIDLQPDGDARRGRVQAAEGHHPRVGRALQRRPGDALVGALLGDPACNPAPEAV